MSEIQMLIEDQLDRLILEHPMEFPNGEHFISGLEEFLKLLVEDEIINSWSILPLASEGFKVEVMNMDDELEQVIRTPEGGRK